ncbi:type II toxin-antitoxin system VapC family toxin [soil metagenome]
MIVDTSAALAVLFGETGFERLVDAIVESELAGMGAPTLCETGIVLTARVGGGTREMLDGFVLELGIEPIPFGERHWREAIEALHRFGKGRHQAGLNFGDCMSYATARVADLPLLYLGEDFSLTDIGRVSI